MHTNHAGNASSATGVSAQGARRTIATFSDYREAEALVDRLADAGFDVSRVAIVGRDLRVVEQVTGMLNAWRAALGGAGSGALLGLLFGFLFGVWFSHDGSSLFGIIVYWTIVGAIVGSALSLLTYAMSGGRRNFTSVSAMTASNYDVLADERFADEALRVLSQTARQGS